MVKLSRSKIELFLDCPRCFWLDMKKGVKRPPPAPYTINSAIDGLLKKEFDVYREDGTAHYIIKKYNIDAIPYKCEQINTWRHNFTGVQFHHKSTDFLVFGAVDNVWANPAGELIVEGWTKGESFCCAVFPGVLKGNACCIYRLRIGLTKCKTRYILGS